MDIAQFGTIIRNKNEGGQIASFSADDSSWMPLNCAVMFFWTVLALSPRILRHGYDKKVFDLRITAWAIIHCILIGIRIHNGELNRHANDVR